MASMQCYKEGKEFDYYSSYGYQKPTTYSNSGYEKTYYEKEGCYETTKPMMGYDGSHETNYPMGHGKVGYGTGYNSYEGYSLGKNNSHGTMGYGHNTHHDNHHMHNKPGPNRLGMGLGLGTGTALGHVMGFGKTHEGQGMGSSGYTTYKKQHYRRRKATGGYGSGSDCSDSSNDERHC